MTLSEAQASRDPIDRVGVSSTDSGLPPITQMAFSACRAHYPGGSVRYRSIREWRCPAPGIPEPRWPSQNERLVGIHNFPFEACSSFTRVTTGEASWPSLSWDKVICSSSLLGRPTDLLAHLKWTLSQGSHPGSYLPKRLVSYPGISTAPGVGLAPTGNLRRWGARSFRTV